MRRRLAAVLGAVVALGTVVTASTTDPALAAANAANTGSFSVAPIDAPGGLNYFQFHLAPGGSANGAVAVAGGASGGVQVHVFAAQGVTAVGSGDAYVAPSDGHCAGASCWIASLPGPLTLTDGQRRDVAFTVRVPPSTPSGQYLAGVGVAQVAPSATTTTKPSKGSAAVTHVERQVVIGVEVTVGSAYPDLLRIDNVTGTRIGNSPGVVVDEAEVGRTIEHPQGTVVVGRGGSARSFPVVSGTVLSGGVASLRVLTTGLRPGSYPASASLRYDSGRKVAHWTGTVTIPAASTSHPISVPPHARVVVVAQGWPGWLVGLLAAAGAVILLMGFALVLVLRRRRPDPRPDVDG